MHNEPLDRRFRKVSLAQFHPDELKCAEGKSYSETKTEKSLESGVRSRKTKLAFGTRTLRLQTPDFY
ncbi:MAG: hypothetical protein DMF68_10095 [Acidobacteria bacterium]|nr:MAG: hypothetical protein DMF68_10095 [Acidobacteriota bacterium]